MEYLEEIREEQRSGGTAAILAIGTATPPNCFNQAEFADYYFRVTKSDHMTQLKAKFKRICESTTIKKRYMHLTEDILKENPNMCYNEVPSLNARQDILIHEVPKLGQKAASNAINEWGRPKSEITHLIFCSSSGEDMPCADFQLLSLLDLKPSTKRFMIHFQGCNAGGTVLRLAKDLAENSANARVLVVCSEITLGIFRAPSETALDNMVGQALFSDGASAAIIGCVDDNSTHERPLFHIVAASQAIIPNSEFALQGHVREEGYSVSLAKNLPEIIAENLEKILTEAFDPIGISEWNSLFWIVHPGGPRILNLIEAKVGLKQEKLRASRHVLSEYGNTWGSTVLFVLDEMRKESMKEGKTTTGEGLRWGVLFGFGPGLTVETIVLHSATINAHV